MAAEKDADAGPIAWDVAEQVSRRLLRSSTSLDRTTLKRLNDDFLNATAHGEALVEKITGLKSQDGDARSMVTDRPGWISGNLSSFRRLLSPLVERLASEKKSSGVIGTAGRTVAGAEIGAVLAWMSKRVLGQYDPLPFEEGAGGDVIYFVGPNIVSIERRHAFPPKEFRLWITLHELTHRTQFTAVPWMREYFFGLIDRATSLADPSKANEAISRLYTDMREGRNPLAGNGIVSVFASKDQLGVIKEAQAFMSLLEGHGNYVMSRAGAGEIPGAARFARVLSERRVNSRGATKLIQQLLGIEAKLRQYDEGEQFIEAVVASGGDELLARVWTSPAMLPTPDEIKLPQLWIDRAGGNVAIA